MLDDRTELLRKNRLKDGSVITDYINNNNWKMDFETVASFMITQPFEHRPDLISFKVYGNYNMGWLISLHNNFLDPFTDYKRGTVIKIPSLEDYYRFYNRNKKSKIPLEV